MRMLIGGEWIDREARTTVTRPYDGAAIDTVPAASAGDVRAAIDAAEAGAAAMRGLAPHERSSMLRRAAGLLDDAREEIAHLLAQEVGKTIKEARGEASRPPAIFELCAEATRDLGGELLPYGAAPGTENRRGYWMRVPVGIVSAISPFNFPAALSAHKVGPALAAGNAVVLKPAGKTPLALLRLAEAVVEAGFPPGALNVVTCSGADAEPMLTDPRVRAITFTGSTEVGETITRKAGIKRLHLELGSNSAVAVMADADLDDAWDRLVSGPFTVAGQVCISVQRILVEESGYARFLEEYVPRVQALRTGDPLDESTDIGPMISEQAAHRAEQWVAEAVAAGARVLCGGTRVGTLFEPTVAVDCPHTEKLWAEEAFAPIVLVEPVADLDEAIAMTNESKYGLQAGIYTSDVDKAFRFAEAVDCGGVNVNDISFWRADFQPYGGRKLSGIGREGVRFAIEEMTEQKVVAFRLR
ncbi:MAG TPA: aldehyde dehydrogenase [Armatimonadetes bacterium]|nr:aldehyde dehydrogenase [Armatimonadota bacterium]